MTAYRSLKAIPKASSLFVPRTVHEGLTKGGAKCEISPGSYCSELQKPAYFTKPANTSADNRAFAVQKNIFRPEYISIQFRPENSFFEGALWARKITILDPLAAQFRTICGLEDQPNSDSITSKVIAKDVRAAD